VTGVEIALTVVAGLVMGILSAIFGVGGGQVVIPFMVLVLGADQHLAEGTSLAVIVPTALVGAWAHARRGFVSRRATGLLVVGGVVGAVAGALVAHQLDRPALVQLGLLARRERGMEQVEAGRGDLVVAAPRHEAAAA